MSMNKSSATDIALVISDLGGGGTQRVLAFLAAAWASRGRRVAVITLAGPDCDVVPLAESVQRVALDSADTSRGLISGFVANVRRVGRLRAALRRLAAPVVIGFIGSTNILVILASRGLGCRVVISERNDPARQSLGRTWDLLRRRLYGWADVVTANSDGVLATMAGFVPREKLLLTPNPLRTLSDVRAEGGQRKSLLAVGRLHAQKAFEVLLGAFARTSAPEKGWRLTILGEGPIRDQLTAEAERLGIADLVHMPGFVDDPFPFYREADVFVLPSRHEGMPNALLEAMSCGLPAIVSDASPGPLELVRHEETGLAVPADDTGSLAQAIDRLIENPGLRQRIGEAGRRSALARSDPDSVLAAWEQAIRPDSTAVPCTPA